PGRRDRHVASFCEADAAGGQGARDVEVRAAERQAAGAEVERRVRGDAHAAGRRRRRHRDTEHERGESALHRARASHDARGAASTASRRAESAAISCFCSALTRCCSFTSLSSSAGSTWYLTEYGLPSASGATSSGATSATSSAIRPYSVAFA